VLAEVGVVIRPDGTVSSYVEQGIVDDPDPIGSAWVRNHPDGGIRIALNPDGAGDGDGDPALLARPAPEYPIAAWAESTPGGYDIVVSRFDGAAWTVPEVVADEAADEFDPQLARDPQDGTVHLVYWVHDPVPRVVHRQAPADLASWSPAAPVSHPNEAACRPSVALHDGVVHVVYEVHDLGHGTTPRRIMLAIHDGQQFASEMVATTLHDGENWPRVHGAGALVWIDWIDAVGEMTWTRRVLGGPWEPVEIESFQTPEEREFHVRGLIRLLALH
jgi:hypothetical protein